MPSCCSSLLIWFARALSLSHYIFCCIALLEFMVHHDRITKWHMICKASSTLLVDRFWCRCVCVCELNECTFLTTGHAPICVHFCHLPASRLRALFSSSFFLRSCREPEEGQRQALSLRVCVCVCARAHCAYSDLIRLRQALFALSHV